MMDSPPFIDHELRRRIEPLCRDALGPRPMQRKKDALQIILEAIQEVR